jgi:hypothetical protein
MGLKKAERQVRDARARARAEMGFPRQLGSEGWVIDEMCTCDAMRSEHRPRFALGHGPCARTGCGQFTWAGHVLSDGRVMVADREVSRADKSLL